MRARLVTIAWKAHVAQLHMHVLLEHIPLPLVPLRWTHAVVYHVLLVIIVLPGVPPME
jgi:hypothetical protein